MALPTASPLTKALQEAQQLWTGIKSWAANRKATMAAGNVTADYVLDVHRHAVDVDGRLATYATVPGIVQYAKDQYDNQAYDIAADFTALRSAIQAVRDEVETAIPKDTPTPYLLTHQFTANVLTPRTFSSANTATLQTLLQAVVDAVA